MMKRALTLLLVLAGIASATSQQLYLETFYGLNKTSYDKDIFKQKKSYPSLGFRLAGGADHLQVGGEYKMNLKNPVFDTLTGTQEHDETYYGAFLRAKISKYPAMRFGLVLRAGAGFYKYEVLNSTAIYPDLDYDPILGFNGGVGLSIPAFKAVMVELGYTYNYIDRPELNELGGFTIAGHTSSYHTFSVGLSLNFVFGERAKNYKHLKENWRWRDGWRG